MQAAVILMPVLRKAPNIVRHIKLTPCTLEKRSNIKKNRRDAPLTTDNEDRRQKLLSYTIIFAGSFLFIWAIILFSKTFISNLTQLIIVFCGAALGIVCTHYLWRHKKYGLFATLFYGFLVGAPIPYSLLATTNYYFSDGNSENIRLDILATGNRSTRRRNCRTPYVTIEYQNITKDIPLPCDYEKTISQYKILTLKIDRGFWGYPLYIDKNLSK